MKQVKTPFRPALLPIPPSRKKIVISQDVGRSGQATPVIDAQQRARLAAELDEVFGAFAQDIEAELCRRPAGQQQASFRRNQEEYFEDAAKAVELALLKVFQSRQNPETPWSPAEIMRSAVSRELAGIEFDASDLPDWLLDETRAGPEAMVAAAAQTAGLRHRDDMPADESARLEAATGKVAAALTLFYRLPAAMIATMHLLRAAATQTSAASREEMAPPAMMRLLAALLHAHKRAFGQPVDVREPTELDDHDNEVDRPSVAWVRALVRRAAYRMNQRMNDSRDQLRRAGRVEDVRRLEDARQRRLTAAAALEDMVEWKSRTLAKRLGEARRLRGPTQPFGEAA